jgi:hypothetical protein
MDDMSRKYETFDGMAVPIPPSMTISTDLPAP